MRTWRIEGFLVKPVDSLLLVFASRYPSALIEVFNVKPDHKKAIILSLYRTDVKVLKDALAC